MKINFINHDEAIHVDKDNGTAVDDYIFNEYEIHVNKILPHTIQEYHMHHQIKETILVIKGKLLCRYIEDKEYQRYLNIGDIVEVNQMIHTFENDSDEVVEFVVFRFVPEGIDKREIIKNDKELI